MTYDLPETVQEVFLRLWRDIGAVTPDNFEDLLFTLSVSVSANNAKKHPGSKTELPAFSEVRNVPDFGTIRKSFDSYTPDGARPDSKTLGFYNEMINSLPLKNRELLMLTAFTSLSADDIASATGEYADYVENNVRESYSYLIHQAKRADLMGFDFVKFIPHMPLVIDSLARGAVAPGGLWKPIAQAVGYDENTEPQTPAEPEHKAPVRKIPKVKKSLSPKTKRIIASAVLLCVLAAVICTFIFYAKSHSIRYNNALPEVSGSEPDLWDGSAQTAFESGSGTKEDPYIISSPGQLKLLSDLVNEGNMEYFACYYALSADIDMSAAEFTPIGYRKSESDYKYFCGEFDGRGHTLTGLNITSDNCAGLFGYALDASIKNVNLTDCRISGEKYCAGIVGFYTSRSAKGGVYGCSVQGSISGSEYVGGIAGFADISGQNASFSIEKCSVSGLVSASGQTAGGIAGRMQTKDGSAVISDCLNLADISSSDNAGGIVGANQLLSGSAGIKTCVNLGSISCKNETRGSLAGLNDSVSSESKAYVDNCLYLISTCDKDVNSGENSYVNAAGLMEEQFSQEINFDGFDTQNIWIVSPDGMPKLK